MRTFILALAITLIAGCTSSGAKLDPAEIEAIKVEARLQQEREDEAGRVRLVEERRNAALTDSIRAANLRVTAKVTQHGLVKKGHIKLPMINWDYGWFTLVLADAWTLETVSINIPDWGKSYGTYYIDFAFNNYPDYVQSMEILVYMDGRISMQDSIGAFDDGASGNATSVNIAIRKKDGTFQSDVHTFTLKGYSAAKSTLREKM